MGSQQNPMHTLPRMCCLRLCALISVPLYLVFSLFAYCLVAHCVLQPGFVQHACLFAINRVCLRLCVGVRLQGRPVVYMGHSLRSHNPTFEPIYSQGVSLFPVWPS